MSNEPKITVVVPAKNEEEKIEKCLSAIFNQTLQPFEVIVVDGHSTDRTEEIARKFPVRIFYDDYGSIGSARQVGIDNAKGEYVAFTDADCIPEKTWLENLSKELNSGIVGVGGGTKNIGEGLWKKSISLALDSFLGSANSVQDRVFKEKRFVRSLSGCNCMYRRSDIMKVGGFNIKLSINEDTEMGEKLRKFGKLLYIPNAIVLHNQNRSFKDFVRRMYKFGYGRAKNRIWDLQCIPPVIALFVFLSLVISPTFFFFMISLYALVLLYFNFKIFLNSKKAIYLISVPIVFIVQHLAYTLGFWRGIISFGGGDVK